MKICLRRATGIVTLLALGMFASPVVAQQPAPRGAVAPARPASGGAVAVIDISKIFKEHTGFKKMLEDLKRDVDAAGNELKRDQEELKKLVDQLKQYQQGSPNFKRLEEEIATRQAQLQLKMNLQKKDFMEREAKIYFQVYTQIQNEVQYFAQRHGIALVLRHNSDEVRPEDRNSVLAGVNKAVVYQNNIDITYDILERLVPRQGAGGPTNGIPSGGGAVPAATRPTSNLPR